MAKKIYTQINNGLTLVSAHKDNYKFVAIIALSIIVSAFFIPLFFLNFNEIVVVFIPLAIIPVGFIIGQKCTYVRCCMINLKTKKIKLKEKFITGWKRSEFPISDLFVHSKYFPETDNGETTGTAEYWEVKASKKSNNKKIMVQQFYNKDEAKTALKDLVDILYPELVSLRFEDVFQIDEDEIVQIKFE